MQGSGPCHPLRPQARTGWGQERWGDGAVVPSLPPTPHQREPARCPRRDAGVLEKAAQLCHQGRRWFSDSGSCSLACAFAFHCLEWNGRVWPKERCKSPLMIKGNETWPRQAPPRMHAGFLARWLLGLGKQSSSDTVMTCTIKNHSSSLKSKYNSFIIFVSFSILRFHCVWSKVFERLILIF